ncbi:hypothetical protein GCM10025868_39840 [Angustibacter aerolatus]|uniref:Peptidase S8/S53 domain-containing protein n=1 Tax=Angustibacter aerolatus TaxID=1162965 RepID=A0ABQ6JN25_9ACTN|nr:hypothetical protein GCM10025868_39840 [Angustibacter aerolatus]
MVGGTDLVGDAYDGTPAHPPVPDANPMDCDTHGTHVASTAAGRGVTSSGATYAGPWTSGTDLSTMTVAPGVAPEADLYAVKVFGCGDGGTAVVAQALEWAADPDHDGDFTDKMDVVNLSLGSDFASPDDPDAVAANQAAAAGTVVVAAAGNTGDLHDAVSSPASASRVIAVAASDDGSGVAGGVRSVRTDAVDDIATFSARGFGTAGEVKPDVAAPGVTISAANSRSGTGARTMSGTSMASPQVAGAAAVVRGLHPDWDVERVKAALMNTAATVTGRGDPALPVAAVRAGAGRVQVDAAARTTTLATADAVAGSPGAVGVSFGDLPVSADTVLTRTVTVRNLSGAARSLRAVDAGARAAAGVRRVVLGARRLGRLDRRRAGRRQRHRAGAGAGRPLGPAAHRRPGARRHRWCDLHRGVDAAWCSPTPPTRPTPSRCRSTPHRTRWPPCARRPPR